MLSENTAYNHQNYIQEQRYYNRLKIIYFEEQIYVGIGWIDQFET